MAPANQQSLREALALAKDARVIDTRRRLLRAFQLEAAKEHPDFTVAALARQADVGRSTFYTHFATVEDLAVYVVHDLFSAVTPGDAERRQEHAMTRREITTLGITELINTLSAERSTLVGALALAPTFAVHDRFTSAMADLLGPVIVAERPDADRVALDIAGSYLAAGTMRVIVQWIVDPGEIPKQRLVAEVLALLPTWLVGD